MAIVLDAFASYVADLLKQVVEDEVGMLLGITGDIDNMGVKLEDLKNFLADADRRRITDKSVQGWVTELKRAMYDATDILDSCQLKAMDQQAASASRTGCCNPLLFCLRNPRHAHDIGTRIKALNQKLDAIKERSAAFGFINLCSYDDRSSGNVHSSRLAASRETSGELDRSGVVGEKIHEDTRALVETMLTETHGETGHPDNILSVFAIVGVGGIGKTTLAQKVFNDEAIQREFDKKIWLSVNKDFSESELLRRAITEAGGDHRQAGNAKTTLQRTLKDALNRYKTLLVMDDVWNPGAWECALKTPLANAAAPGSRVLVTTRDERVARGMKALLPYHHIDKLVDEDAWSLLKRQVVASETDGPEIDMLKDIGLQIVEKCGGLPLAVKVMGGLLCQKDKQRGDWEMVLNDSIWSVSEMPEELNYAVYLSYEDLPPRIKQCFLYNSLLPKLGIFDRDRVIALWIGEGFLHGASADLEELGRKYYKELVLRNLLEPENKYVDQLVCNMHDVVRSFAQFVARDEALAVHSGENDIISKLSEQKFLRLSIEIKPSESDLFDWSSLQAQKTLTLRTLISLGPINIKPGDSLTNFPCLRILNIDHAKTAVLVESLGELKYLRYLSIEGSDISSLPDNIGEMKFLQYINLSTCKQIVELPNSIVKLGKLRYLDLRNSAINGIPRGFCVLTNLRSIHGFPAQVDGDWCSLEELGPLSQLRALGVKVLENISATSSAAKARFGEKVHLTTLDLDCTSILGDDLLIKEEEGVSEDEQRRIEGVFDELCPPPSLDNLTITGYFGRRLPSWMSLTLASSLRSLRIIMMEDLACCTQLPDGLSQLPCLDNIQIKHAPSIKRIGPEFLQPCHHHHTCPSQAATAFPRLNRMYLSGMIEWEEWVWEEEVQAMPVLKELSLTNCKLRRLPHGLASSARSLRKLFIQFVQHLSYVENFAFVVELTVYGSPDLERITNFPRLQNLAIAFCPKLRVVVGVPALRRLLLEDHYMETLPEYVRDINPSYLQVDCRQWLLASVAAGHSGPEWDKFNHVEHVKAYANDGYNRRKWYMMYWRDPYSLETNMNYSFISAGTLSTSMVEIQGSESVFRMRRSTLNYICGLVDVPSLQDMSICTFLDGSVMSLPYRVALALLTLNYGEQIEAIGSFVGVNEAAVSLVTKWFAKAVYQRAKYRHLRWPDSGEMEKIKYKFEKVYGLPNCCGVVHTFHITVALPPAEANSDHAANCSHIVQVVVDPDLRFRHVYGQWSSSTNKFSILHDSQLFKECEKGAWLSGSKLKVSSDGLEVAEYIIGEEGYPLLPWLLTPYQLEKDLPDPPHKVEFNKRHSEAIAATGLARFSDTWKFMYRAVEHWDNPNDLGLVILACCTLHNIVIDMECEAGMPVDHKENCSEQVPLRRVADEDPVRVRDILSQHFASRLSDSGGNRSVGADDERQVV